LDKEDVMGEAARRAALGFAPIKPGQPVEVDMKNATPFKCVCGSDIFIPAIRVFSISALVSPTGQELTIQQPVLVCKECNKVFDLSR
jgi:hypothetical protein